MKLSDVSKAWTLQEIAQLAKHRLPQTIWDYLVGGSETETTVIRNRRALETWAFRPRVCRDVSTVSVSGRFLGHDLRLPVVLPPIGSIQVFDPDGAATVARAAETFGSLQFVSSVARPDLDVVAAASSAPKVYQLYLVGDEAWMNDQIHRAIDAGYAGFCLTVDTQVPSRRERDLLKRWLIPSGSATIDFSHQARITWDLVARVKEAHDIPLILKGIATPEDAKLACDHGVDVIYVSNHGGRQLDCQVGTLETLPDIVAAVAGRSTVAFDGGVLRGTDVIKALILGADVVGAGRLYCLGLAAGGAAGVVRVLEILEQEIKTSLALLGVSSLADLDRSYLARDRPTGGGGGEDVLRRAFSHWGLERSTL